MKLNRRSLLFAGVVAVMLPTTLIGTKMAQVPMPRMFGIVYNRKTKVVRRLVDPSMDPHDGALQGEYDTMDPGEVMELFPQHQFPVRLPYMVEAYLGTGVIV